jgi:hypothetical protein
VKRRGRKAAEGVRDLLGRDVAGFSGRPVSKQIREDGTRSDGGHAALRLELRSDDARSFDPNSKAQDIPADGIRDFNGRRRIGEVADVVRIAEMFEDRKAVHRPHYKLEPTTRGRSGGTSKRWAALATVHRNLSPFL